ncbi:MAG: hypothetical protein GXO37_05170 [Chloroflexi bacterium]|nr:hypothetical protein [Chloroflexota bacterium]
MLRDPEAWAQWEREWERQQSRSYEENLRLFLAMLDHARALGVWPPQNPLEGLETDILLARRINTYVPPPVDTSGQGAG